MRTYLINSKRTKLDEEKNLMITNDINKRIPRFSQDLGIFFPNQNNFQKN